MALNILIFNGDAAIASRGRNAAESTDFRWSIAGPVNSNWPGGQQRAHLPNAIESH